MHYIALTGAGMLVVGWLLPWISLGTLFVQHVPDTFYGAVALLSGLLAAGVAIHNIVTNQNKMKYAYLAIGGIGLIIGACGPLGVRDLRTTTEFVDERQKQMFEERDMPAATRIMNTGLWFVVIGGMMLSGTGLVNVFSQKSRSAEGPLSAPDRGAGHELRTFGTGGQKATILNGIAGAYAGQQIPIPLEGVVIGRDPAYSNLVIQSPAVSRRHARIVQGPFPDSCTLEDLNSTNGTFIMERNVWVRLTTPVVLTLLKRFRLGDEHTEFEIR